MAQEVTYKNGFKVINNYPDYTPEQQEKVNEIVLEKLYNIFFSDNKID